MRPRAWRIIMLTVSGVAFDAAITRSPSFSRFSSSVTMTSFPAAMSARASSMVSKGSFMKVGGSNLVVTSHGASGEMRPRR
jgi:hypothetical protein